MRGAPPVRVLCGPDARWQRVQQLILAAAASTGVGWLLWHAGWERGPILAAALAVAVAVALAVPKALPQQTVVLEWTGEGWRLDGQACQPHVRIDLGPWLLLQTEGGSARRWLPLDLARCGALPHLVRAALQAHGRAAAGAWEEGGRG
ncbi:MAG: hypothetical protein U1F56_05970 [Rubrivivax sp.]